MNFPDNTGILFASGDNWTRMRRFTLKALRDHGFGKKASETYILDEALHMVEYLRSIEICFQNCSHLLCTKKF